MSALLASLSGTVIEAAAGVLRQPASWPGLDSGFAFHLLSAAGAQLPDAYRAPLRPAEPLALRRTPELAAFGYLLSSQGTEAEVHGLWAAAFDRLPHREAFPSDRNSFFFNPLELLGISVGVATCDAVPPAGRKWLGSLLDKGWSERLFPDTRTQLLALRASAALGRDVPPPRGAACDPTDLDDESLLLAFALTGAVGGTNPCAFLGCSEATLETAVLRRVLGGTVRVADAAEAAAAYVAVRRLVERALVDPGSTVDASARVAALFRRFHLFAERLRTRQRGRPGFEIADEYDLQDALHAMLRLHFNDVRPEEWTPSYAGNASRIDFYLPRERTIVEAKMTRRNLGQREVADELIIDKERYSRFPDVDSLICLVYDPNRRCPNPAGLENDLHRRGGGLNVTVVVCPSGL